MLTKIKVALYFRLKEEYSLGYFYMSNVTLTFFSSFQTHFSFGFSDKVTLNGHVPVGLYGNGFKSGSMRLGKDAIVFTKNGDVMSVGLLSQTFLEITKAEHVIVPIISFNKNNILLVFFFLKEIND